MINMACGRIMLREEIWQATQVRSIEFLFFFVTSYIDTPFYQGGKGWLGFQLNILR